MVRKNHGKPVRLRTTAQDLPEKIPWNGSLRNTKAVIFFSFFFRDKPMETGYSLCFFLFYEPFLFLLVTIIRRDLSISVGRSRFDKKKIKILKGNKKIKDKSHTEANDEDVLEIVPLLFLRIFSFLFLSLLEGWSTWSGRGDKKN